MPECVGGGASSERRTITAFKCAHDHHFTVDMGGDEHPEIGPHCPLCGTSTVRVVEQQSGTEGERAEALEWPKTLYLCFECGGFDDSPLPHRHGQGLKEHLAQKLGIGVVPVVPESPEHQPDDELCDLLRDGPNVKVRFRRFEDGNWEPGEIAPPGAFTAEDGTRWTTIAPYNEGPSAPTTLTVPIDKDRVQVLPSAAVRTERNSEQPFDPATVAAVVEVLREQFKLGLDGVWTHEGWEYFSWDRAAEHIESHQRFKAAEGMSGFYDPCGCDKHCGDDGDTEGPGVCKGLPRMPEPPLIEFFVVHRDEDPRRFPASGGAARDGTGGQG